MFDNPLIHPPNYSPLPGIQMLPSYQLYPTSQELPTLSWRDAVMGYRLLNSDEIQRLLGPANTIYQAGHTKP